MPSLRSESLGNALAAKVQSLAEPAGAKVRASTRPAALRFGLARVVSAPCLFALSPQGSFLCPHKDVNNSKKVVPRSSLVPRLPLPLPLSPNAPKLSLPERLRPTDNLVCLLVCFFLCLKGLLFCLFLCLSIKLSRLSKDLRVP